MPVRPSSYHLLVSDAENPNLSGIAKDICLITGSVFFLGSQVTHLQIAGYGVAACGLVYFRFGPDGKEIIDTPALGGPTYEAVPLGPLEGPSCLAHHSPTLTSP